jgi:hypothetical protein
MQCIGLPVVSCCGEMPCNCVVLLACHMMLQLAAKACGCSTAPAWTQIKTPGSYSRGLIAWAESAGPVLVVVAVPALLRSRVA